MASTSYFAAISGEVIAAAVGRPAVVTVRINIAVLLGGLPTVPSSRVAIATVITEAARRHCVGWRVLSLAPLGGCGR